MSEQIRINATNIVDNIKYLSDCFIRNILSSIAEHIIKNIFKQRINSVISSPRNLKIKYKNSDPNMEHVTIRIFFIL